MPSEQDLVITAFLRQASYQRATIAGPEPVITIKAATCSLQNGASIHRVSRSSIND